MNASPPVNHFKPTSGKPAAGSGPAESQGGRYYRPELDALRFFAFLCVFSLHTSYYIAIDPIRHLWLSRVRNTGTFGVQLFFFLSAFLITDLLFRERERTGRIHIQAFYVRRILRIWPLYFSVFFGLALLNHFVPGTGTDDPHAWLAFTFLCGNWYIAHHGWIAGPVDPLWSISIEEQFYLVIPILAARGGRGALWVVTCVLLAVGYMLAFSSVFHLHEVVVWPNSFLQFPFFCAGTMLALFLRGRALPTSAPLRIGCFAGGILCWLATPLSSLYWLLVLIGTILLFLSTYGTPPRLIPPWLAYFGKISYGLYLFHALVFALIFRVAGKPPIPLLYRNRAVADAYRGLLVPAALAIDLLLAHLSYVYFEGYFLRLKRRFTFVATRDT